MFDSTSLDGSASVHIRILLLEPRLQIKYLFNINKDTNKLISEEKKDVGLTVLVRLMAGPHS